MSDSPETPAPGLSEPMNPDDARLRTRGVLVLLFAIVAVVLAVGGVVIATSDDDEPASPGATAEVPVACGAVISKPVGRSAIHVDGTPITYADAPPAFGDHRSVPATFGRPFYAGQDRPEVGNLVHSLEHGYTIAWYDETAAADADAMAELAEIANDYQDQEERFIAAPWLDSDGPAFPGGTHVALTRWSADPLKPGDVAGQQGNWMYCGTVEPAAIDTFFETWPNNESAEPGLY